MATEKKFFYVARQNQVRDSKMFGKWYPEAYVLQTLSTRALAKHIQKHGSPYTLDVIMGVLIAFAEVTVEECMASNAVKIDGLGTFRPEIESTKGGAESKDLCDQSKVAGIHLRFTPEGSNIGRGRAEDQELPGAHVHGRDAAPAVSVAAACTYTRRRLRLHSEKVKNS